MGTPFVASFGAPHLGARGSSGGKCGQFSDYSHRWTLQRLESVGGIRDRNLSSRVIIYDSGSVNYTSILDPTQSTVWNARRTRRQFAGTEQHLSSLDHHLAGADCADSVFKGRTACNHGNRLCTGGDNAARTLP